MATQQACVKYRNFIVYCETRPINWNVSEDFVFLYDEDVVIIFVQSQSEGNFRFVSWKQDTATATKGQQKRTPL